MTGRRSSHAHLAEDAIRDVGDDEHDVAPEPAGVEYALAGVHGLGDIGGHLLGRRHQGRRQQQALGHRRIHEARLDGGEIDAGLEQPRPQAAAEGGDGALGGAVQIVGWPAAVARHRRDHADAAGALGFHRVGEMGEQADERQAVAGEFADRQLGVLLAGFLVWQGAVGNQHHVHAAEPGEGFTHEASVAFEDVQVELAGVHLGTAGGKIIRHLAELVGAAADEVEAHPALAPAPGAGSGNGGRGADDQDVFHAWVTRFHKREHRAGSRRASSCVHWG